MSKANSRIDQKPSPADEAGPHPAEASGKKGLPFPILAAGAATLFAAAGAGVFFLAPTPKADGAAKESHGAPAKHKGKADSKGGHGKDDAAAAPGGAFHDGGENAFWILDPLVVSIAPLGRARHLKITLAVETSHDAQEAVAQNALRLRDVFNAYLRSVDAAMLEDPAAMAALRAQLKRRAALALAPAPVHDVLITEFVLS